MNEQKPKSAPEHPYNRACDACRLHKVRCLPNESSSSKICQRCARTDRQCIFTAPQKRKQRKRTDTRVAELEREVQAMRALFDSKRAKVEGDTTDKSDESSKLGVWSETNGKTPQRASTSTFSSDKAGATSTSGSSSPKDVSNTPWPSSQYSPDFDVIDQGIVSMDQAGELYQTYNNHLAEHYPAVVFAPGTPAEELRKTKPTLFLAVIAAAAGKSDPSLYSVLNSMVLNAYAHRTVINSEKSLELVQAMIITCVWYFPPGKFSQLKFYEYIHMAATMAMDIGLGTNPRSSRSRRGGEESNPLISDQGVILSDAEIERRRTFLVCYIMTTGASISMRRPNMLRYNTWVGECLEVVANNPNPLPFDKYLVGWAQLSKIAEEIHSSFSFDDPGNMVNLSEPRVQIMLNSFVKALEAWRRSLGPEGSHGVLLLSYHHTLTYLHELALHDDHPPEDFMPPYKLDKVISIQTDPKAQSIHIDATVFCISNAHSVLDILLGLDVEVLRSLPIFNFVRMTYEVIVLTKLYISSKSPGSKIGAVLEAQTIKLDFYLEALIKRLEEATGPMECRAPYTFLGLLNGIQLWYKSQENDQVFKHPTSLPFNGDWCWLPPVPPLIKPEMQDLSINDDEQVQNGPLQDPLYGMDFSGSADLDGFQFDSLDNNQDVLYDETTSFDTSFMNLPSNMDISDFVNSGQIPEAFEWGFQPTGPTPR